MNNKKRINTSLILSFVGIFIVLIISLLVFFWESFGRYKVLYTSVITLKQDVNKGTVITKDMLQTVSFEKNKLIKNPIVNSADIVGKVSKHYIPQNSPLSKLYFDNVNLVTDKNSFITKIPNDWILSVPNTIRRGDKAAIYLSKDNTASITNNSTLNTYTQDQLNSVKSNLGSKLIETTVAYAKDSNNKEVQDQSNQDRLNGSSKIDSVEVILTADELTMMQQYALAGNKFIIVYSDNN